MVQRLHRGDLTDERQRPQDSTGRGPLDARATSGGTGDDPETRIPYDDRGPRNPYDHRGTRIPIPYDDHRTRI
ncbi:hypothetical protein ACFXAZ_00295 [Streptomyces sp. NPDC059477]|uniref:hypothetical protein n=1 Tax=Streptomyces sp. NPDC059477 TaxID=3346847 RepID=UPI0036B2663D